jgi:transcriptional regulator with XRE-family HTH domain
VASRTIGDNIRAARDRRGLTQQALADKLGMRQPQLNGIENGRYGSTSPKTLLRLAKAVECSIDDLLLGVDEAYDQIVPTRRALAQRPARRRRKTKSP